LNRLITLVCVLFVVFMMISVAPAAAQTRPAPEQGTITHVFDHFVVRGGAITWFVLLPLSVATVALTLQYCVSIRRATILPASTLEQYSELIGQKRYADVLEHAASDRSVLAYVINNGLAEAGNGFAAMERAIEEAIEERTARLMRKIEYLNIIAAVSPMIGLFGTVVGMIGLFSSIGNLGNNVDADKIAWNISVALVTTFWGLLIAIPALSIFALFRNRIEELTAECALVAERVLSVFKPNEGVPEGPSPAGRAPARDVLRA